MHRASFLSRSVQHWCRLTMATIGESASGDNSCPKAPSLCSQRWNLGAISFLGIVCIYVVRVNLSVAVICMVRQPPSNESGQPGLKPSVTLIGSDVAVTSYTSLRSRSAWHEMSDLAYLTSTGVPLEMLAGDSGGGECELGTRNESSQFTQSGEFLWDKNTLSRLLSIYFYGYIFTQIPGGWLAGRFGGRRVWGACQIISAVCSLFTPLAARANIYLTYVLRFVLGLAAGVSFPCVLAMMGRWAPKLERTKLVSLSFSGAPVGTIITFAFSGLLCAYGFDDGWGSIFYLAGAGNMLWVLFWFLITADTPSQHPRIRGIERKYILASIGEKPNTKAELSIPWLAMMKSGPLWAVISAHVFNNYTSYTLLTSLPSFMKEVLKFDTMQNGGLSALPYVCEAVVSVAAGQLADHLREKGILSTRSTRKIFQVTSFLGTAICIGMAGYMACDQRLLAVFLFCLCLSFMGLNRCGYVVNHIDLAPRHAGLLYGITNTVATIPGMVAPVVAGALTPHRTLEEWRYVFLICSGVATLGAIVYALLADGELQSWAVPRAEEILIDLDRNDKSRQQMEMSDPISDWQKLKGSDVKTDPVIV